ncbi:MAG TPA: methyltransferase [Rudaea sp.]|nr:methyltransferase [Rudaea sp.]
MRMNWLEHRIPPPLVGALIGAAMWATARLGGRLAIAANVRLGAAIVLAGIGVALAVAGARAFRRATTTLDPRKPEAASTLVVGGIYRFTRNPMYLGVATVLLAWTVYLAAPLALAGVVLFVAYMTCFQIIPEERALTAKFGADYAEYRSKVRRWL